MAVLVTDVYEWIVITYDWRSTSSPICQIVCSGKYTLLLAYHAYYIIIKKEYCDAAMNGI